MLRLLIIFSFLAFALNAQVNYYQKFNYSNAACVTDQTSNSNLLITASNKLVFAVIKYYTNISPAFNTTSAFIKTDINGNFIFKKTFRNPDDVLPYDIIETKDKGYLLTGHTHQLDTFGGTASNILIKTDSSGNVLWSRAMGGWYGDSGFKTTEINDSTYFGAGNDTSNAGDIYYYKINKSGNLNFGKVIGGIGTETARSVVYSNGSIYLLGNTIRSFDTINEALLCKIDLNGAVIWAKSYSFSGDFQISNFLTKKNSNKFCISGSYTKGPAFVTDGAYLLEVDSMGNALNSKGYDIDSLDNVTSVCPNNTNGYVMSMLSTPPTQLGNFYSILLDNNLNITNKSKLNTSTNIFQTQGPTIIRKNNSIFLGGISYDIYGPYAYPFILKTDSTGTNPCSLSSFSISTNTFSVVIKNRILSSSDNSKTFPLPVYTTTMNIVDSMRCTIPTSIENFGDVDHTISVYPNPTSNKSLTVSSTSLIEKINIFSELGGLLKSVYPKNYSEMLILNDFESQLFLIEIQTDNMVYRKKIICIR